jgi:hypothetical protein
MLPDHAPDLYYNRSELWNAVEQSERAKNAQLCREVRLALPNEFDNEQNEYLVHEYVRQNFVSRGMCADIAIHNKGDGNPHAHILLTMRPLEQDGTWGAKSRMEYILDDNGERIILPSGRPKVKKITTTDWDDKANAELWRESWANIVNKHLEHFGHDNRVDHRSYERQGLEQIPTIHLGVVAHDMEQKGIATERGDINRSINAANARMQNINKEIRTTKKERHDILNPPPPPKPKLLIDLEKSIKAQNSIGYEKWATLFNLQQMAKTLIFIQENGYTDISSLQVAHQTAKTSITTMQTQVDEIKTEIRALKNQKEAAEAYRRTADVWKEYNSNKWWRQSSKDKFYEDNKADIDTYKAARDYIYVDLKLEKFPSLKTLSSKISGLTDKQNDLQKSLTATREKAKMLNITTHNARMVLGYRELEVQNIEPVPIPPQPQDLWVYTKSFSHAEKAGEMDKYFQSKYLDVECANTINQALQGKLIPKGAFNKAITTEMVELVTKEHGVERVLAAAVLNDTAGELFKYKDWAAEKLLPNEPRLHACVTTDDKVSINRLATFIDKYQDIMETIKARYHWEQGQFNQVSFKDKMVIAKEKVDEYNQNRTTPKQAVSTPTKPKRKSYERD